MTRPGTRDPRPPVGLLLAALMPAWLALPANVGAEPQDDDRQEQAEGRTDALVEELSRALGMTPAEIQALELSPAEMRSLIAGFTEETVVVGSRAQPRSATESAVPVDVLSAADLVSQGTGDLNDQLRTIIPSFNTNTQPVSAASTVVRPAMLRNLAPDHTLVLVNGKRRHRSSVVDWHGGNGVALGSQGPDISVIPAIALRQVEVLRDGAAAQYGSDAIAGVLNFQLKDAASGGSVEVNTGMYGAGDGESAQFAGNLGLPLGATGFANLSLEYGNSNPTDRSAYRSDARALIAAGNTHVRSERPQRWGDPDVDDDLKAFGNSATASPPASSSTPTRTASHRPVHPRHRQRFARPRLAHLVRHRRAPPAGDEPPLRRLVRRQRPDQPRRRGGVAGRAVPRRSLVPRQSAGGRRHGGGRAAGEPAGSGARPHAGARQRGSGVTGGGHRLAGRRRGGRCAGTGNAGPAVADGRVFVLDCRETEPRTMDGPLLRQQRERRASHRRAGSLVAAHDLLPFGDSSRRAGSGQGRSQ